VHTRFWWETPRERDYLEDLSTDGRILKWLIKKWDGGMDWIGLAQDRDMYRTLMNAVTNLPVSIKCGEFVT
jgi:hypothetical protein